jgi:hypothetical protein
MENGIGFLNPSNNKNRSELNSGGRMGKLFAHAGRLDAGSKPALSEAEWGRHDSEDRFITFW